MPSPLFQNLTSISTLVPEGQQAAEDAARRFGLERMASEYIAFYRDILKGDETIRPSP